MRTPMSVETFFTILLLIFVTALAGVVVGLVQAWPRGQGWSWKRAWLLIASAVVLVAVVGYVVTWFVALVFFTENR